GGGGACPAPRRRGGGDRERDGAGPAAVRDRLLLDAAALLGPSPADPPRLRGRRRPDAPRRPRGARDDEADRALHGGAGRGDCVAVPVRDTRAAVPRRRAGARRRVLPARTRPAPLAVTP